MIQVIIYKGFLLLISREANEIQTSRNQWKYTWKLQGCTEINISIFGGLQNSKASSRPVLKLSFSSNNTIRKLPISCQFCAHGFIFFCLFGEKLSLFLHNDNRNVRGLAIVSRILSLLFFSSRCAIDCVDILFDSIKSYNHRKYKIGKYFRNSSNYIYT